MRRSFITLAGFGVTAMLLAACGSGSSSPSITTKPAEAATTTAANAPAATATALAKTLKAMGTTTAHMTTTIGRASEKQCQAAPVCFGPNVSSNSESDGWQFSSVLK